MNYQEKKEKWKIPQGPWSAQHYHLREKEKEALCLLCFHFDNSEILSRENDLCLQGKKTWFIWLWTLKKNYNRSKIIYPVGIWSILVSFFLFIFLVIDSIIFLSFVLSFSFFFPLMRSLADRCLELIIEQSGEWK